MCLWAKQHQEALDHYEFSRMHGWDKCIADETQATCTGISVKAVAAARCLERLVLKVGHAAAAEPTRAAGRLMRQ